MNVLLGYLWTEGVTVKILTRFQIYTGTWGRGLGYYTTEFIVTKHWFNSRTMPLLQRAGGEQQNKIFISAFTAWCSTVRGLKWRSGLKSARPSAFAKQIFLVQARIQAVAKVARAMVRFFPPWNILH